MRPYLQQRPLGVDNTRLWRGHAHLAPKMLRGTFSEVMALRSPYSNLQEDHGKDQAARVTKGYKPLVDSANLDRSVIEVVARTLSPISTRCT